MSIRSNPAAFHPGRYITVFADASHCPDTNAWGYGFWVKWGAPAKTSIGDGGGAHCPNSLEAEVRALEAALDWIAENLLPEDLIGKYVVVQSDCTGALARIKLRFHDFARTHKLGRIYTKHVKGHQGNKCPRSSVNTLCDRNAGRHMRTFRALHKNTQGATP